MRANTRLVAMVGPIIASLVASPQAEAQRSPVWAACANEADSSQMQIGACTIIILEGNQTRKDLASAYNSRGNAYDREGDYDRAIADFTKAIELDAKDAAAYNNRGISYRHEGEDDRAIADYTKAIELDPQYANAYVNRGNAFEAKRDHSRAIADYSKAIEINPRLPAAYSGRGNVFELMGELDQAAADRRKAMEFGSQ